MMCNRQKVGATLREAPEDSVSLSILQARIDGFCLEICAHVMGLICCEGRD